MTPTDSKRTLPLATYRAQLMHIRKAVVPLALLAICAACATNHEHARFDPERDIQSSDVFYVEQTVDDQRELGKLIADNLSARGMTAMTGPGQIAPDSATVLVTYEDRWNWDITMFLIELTITLRDPWTREAFAIGSSYHTSMSRLNPVEMIDEFISNLVKADSDPDGLIQVEGK